MTNKRRKRVHPLHRDGYYIINDAFTPSEELLTELKKQLKSKETSPIFNPDKKRLQKNLKEKEAIIKKLLIETVSTLEKKKIGNGLYLRNPVILQSLPGCQRQPAHADHIPNEEWAKVLLFNDLEDIPLAVVCSVMDSKIDLWRKSINWLLPDEITKDIPRETQELKAGSIFIFRGDLIHAGSAYNEENIRVHLYLDSDRLPHTHNRVLSLPTGMDKEWEKHILDKN